MKYLCLIYFDEAKLAAVPAEELAAIVDECMTYSDQLARPATTSPRTPCSRCRPPPPCATRAGGWR